MLRNLGRGVSQRRIRRTRHGRYDDGADNVLVFIFVVVVVVVVVVVFREGESIPTEEHRRIREELGNENVSTRQEVEVLSSDLYRPRDGIRYTYSLLIIKFFLYTLLKFGYTRYIFYVETGYTSVPIFQ